MIQKTGPNLSELPPFPDNVPTVPIARISLSKILANDPNEGASALEACRTHGFFYLDLTSSPQGETLIQQSEDLLQLSYNAFNHPLESKREHALVKGVSLFGYKEAGTVKQTDPNHRPDTTEFFNIAKDHMHNVAESRSYPDDILSEKLLIASFQKNAHELGMLLLGTLAKRLDLPPSAFTDKNIFTQPAGDHVRLTHKFAHVTDKDAIGLPSHTDFGSITILFNWLGGLQIQSHDPAKQGEWAYVKPLAGHAIINLGDAMVTFTNGVLKSAKHRVVPAPGAQAEVDRYSIVYFVRPHNSVMMEPVEKFRDVEEKVKVAGKFEPEGNGVLTAGDWMVQRAKQMGS
jgi:isopenicillin N synthase-like dioxygenase